MAPDRGDYLLAQQPFSWKFATSLWVLPIVLGFGCMSPIGWIAGAAISQRRRMWVAAAVWSAVTVLLVVCIALANPDSAAEDAPGVEPWDTLATVLLLCGWLGSMVHAAIMVRPVLKDALVRREQLRGPVPAGYGAPRRGYVDQAGFHRMPAPPQPQRGPQPFLGVDADAFYAPGTGPGGQPPRHPQANPYADAPGPYGARAPEPPPAWSPLHRPGGRPIDVSALAPHSPVEPPAHPGAPQQAAGGSSRVDVNSADVDEIAALPRIGATAAAAVLTARNLKGGFRDMEDLIASAGLQPHQVAGLESLVAFGPFRPPPPQRTGRVLDL